MARAVALVRLLLPFALASFAYSVRAQAPCVPRVVLRPSRCGLDVVDSRALASALEVELGGQPDAAPLVELRIEPQPCAPGATRIALTLEAAQGRSRRRVIDLADLADSERARVIALSASELARSTCAVEASLVPAPSWAAAAPIASAPPASSVVPSASSGPPTARSAPSERADAAPSTLRLDLGASLETTVFAAYASALVGGRASVGATSTSLPWLRGAVEGFVLGGAARDPLGDVSLQTYGGALSLAVRGEGKGVRGELGPRVDVGGIRASGTPLDASASGSTAHALLVLPSVTARVLLPLRAALSMMLSISVGHTLVGQRVHADARTAAGIAGPYMSLGVGLQSEL